MRLFQGKSPIASSHVPSLACGPRDQPCPAPPYRTDDALISAGERGSRNDRASAQEHFWSPFARLADLVLRRSAFCAVLLLHEAPEQRDCVGSWPLDPVGETDVRKMLNQYVRIVRRADTNRVDWRRSARTRRDYQFPHRRRVTQIESSRRPDDALNHVGDCGGAHQRRGRQGTPIRPIRIRKILIVKALFYG